MTMSYVKGVMIDNPKLVNVLGECDVPFKLPNDFRMFRKRHRIHHLQKREIFSQLELALRENGLDGDSCVKRMICEAGKYLPKKGKSLVGDLLSAVFEFSEEVNGVEKLVDYCGESTFTQCKFPLLPFILGSLGDNIS